LVQCADAGCLWSFWVLFGKGICKKGEAAVSFFSRTILTSNMLIIIYICGSWDKVDKFVYF